MIDLSLYNGFTGTIAGIEVDEASRFEDNRGLVDRILVLNKDYRFCPTKILVSHGNKGAVRALNFQQVNPQKKRVTCVSGQLWTVLVDLRKGSTTFGKWQGFEMNPQNHRVLIVPPWCAIGCYSITDTISINMNEETSEIIQDMSIFWKDPDLAIAWPKQAETIAILTERAKKFMGFSEYVEKYGGIEV
jgi:dTDP-4-dehydrorhamnose 3,5-epimerase